MQVFFYFSDINKYNVLKINILIAKCRKWWYYIFIKLQGVEK